MRAYAGCLCILLFIAAGGPAVQPALASEAPWVLIAVPRTEVTLGDSLPVSCRVTIPEGVRVSDPAPSVSDSLLGVEKLTVREEKTASGIIRTYGFAAYAISPDTLRIGPFTAAWASASGDSGTVVSNVVVLPVKDVADKPDAPPKPSRDPLAVASRGIPAWLLPLILAILAAIAVWYYLSRRKKPSVAAPPPPKPLDEIEEFERIRSLHLRETGQVKELYLHVTAAMRGFMQRNMGFEALYETTSEIKRALDRTPFESGVKDSIGRIFDEADMVKFARYLPNEELTGTIIDRAITPVKTVLEEKARERERARLAEEEQKKRMTPGTAEKPGGHRQDSRGGER